MQQTPKENSVALAQHRWPQISTFLRQSESGMESSLDYFAICVMFAA